MIRILTLMLNCKDFCKITILLTLHFYSLFSFPEGENDSVDISTYEEARLAPGVWLNDNLIDFDLK